MVKPKAPGESYTVTTEQVLPNDTNPLGTLFGGRLMQWMDIAGGIAAYRHCGKVCVTAAINNVSFDHPVKLGNILMLEAKVSRAFTTSIEVYVEAWIMDYKRGMKNKCNTGIITFVAVDKNGKAVPVPSVIPETEEEKQRYNSALRRRQLSLILAGRMKPDDATELKALFGSPS